MSRLSENTVNSYVLAQALGLRLQTRKLVLTTAESCTGGGVAQAITEVAGSSTWFQAGFVTYADWVKRQVLGVSEQSLIDFGAVSEVVAVQMAEGALKVAGADVAVASTGIAGPDGGSAEKPVGTVWLAWAYKEQASVKSQAACFHFSGDREAVRQATVIEALQGLLKLIN